MIRQFGKYPEIIYDAIVTAQMRGQYSEIRIDPDLVNFKLRKFKDLRNDPDPDLKFAKIMLIGSSMTDVFIYGPDMRIDDMIKKLPEYIGKTWTEIINIELEKNFLYCKNICSQVCKIEDPSHEVAKMDKAISARIQGETNVKDETPEEIISKNNEICAQCNYFGFYPK